MSWHNTEPKIAWQPIATAPSGEHVLFWFPHGERGSGGMETGMIFRDSPDDPIGAFWTHGGPNAGSDWMARDEEQPTHWTPLPAPPST